MMEYGFNMELLDIVDENGNQQARLLSVRLHIVRESGIERRMCGL